MIRKGLLWSAVALAIMLGIIFWVGGTLPEGEKIPLHFDAAGTPDRYGSKSEAMLGLWIIWGMTIFTTALLAGLPKIMPRKANFEKSERAYFAIWIGTLILMVGVMALVAWMMVKTVTSSSVGTAPIKAVSIAMAALFILTGNYLPKTRSNWLIGIRTPWTLSSDLTWEKTHRLTGRLFLAAGAAIVLVTVFAAAEVAVIFSVASVLAASMIGVIYSWWVWRTADDRNDRTDFID